jgi:hypothetical protein
MMDYQIGTTQGRTVYVADAPTELILNTLAAVNSGELPMYGLSADAARDRLNLELFIRERNLRSA